MTGFLGTWLSIVQCTLARLILDLITLITAPYFAWQDASRRSWTNKAVEEMKCVVITGASSGIGAAVALKLAESGRTIVITGRNEKRLAKVEKQLKAKGAKAISRVIDVTDKKMMEDFIEEIDNETPIDLVIANAGVGSRTVSDSWYFNSYDEMIDINLRGVVNTILPCIEKFRGRKRGHIAITGSIGSFIPIIGSGLYSGTKVALYHMIEDLRPYLSIYKIGISLIAPGYVDTLLYPKKQAPEKTQAEVLDASVAAQIIIDGIRANDETIAFPFSSFMKGWVIGSMHPAVMTWFNQSGIAWPKATKQELMTRIGRRKYFDEPTGEEDGTVSWH
jgi:short-subunit dehydrogenase